MEKKVTKFGISSDELFWGFGVELGFIDCECDTMEKLEAEVNKLTKEQFDNACYMLYHLGIDD